MWAPAYAADLRAEIDAREVLQGHPEGWGALLELVGACRLTPEALAALATAIARLEALREASAAMDAAALALAMPKPRPPGARRGRTLTLKLPETLKAAIEAAAEARGQTLAAAVAPGAQPPGPLQLQALAERLEAITARLEALPPGQSNPGNPAGSDPASDASDPVC